MKVVNNSKILCYAYFNYLKLLFVKEKKMICRKILTVFLIAGMLLSGTKVNAVKYTIKDGDCIFDLAERFLGSRDKWMEIVDSNPWILESTIQSDDLSEIKLIPGQVIIFDEMYQNIVAQMKKEAEECILYLNDESERIQDMISKINAEADLIEKELCDPDVFDHECGELERKIYKIRIEMAENYKKIEMLKMEICQEPKLISEFENLT